MGSSPTTIPSGAPGACPASALRVELYSFPYDPLKWATEVVLTNTSSSSCSMIGYPSLSATFADDQAFRPSPVGRWRAGSVTDPDHPSGRFHHPHLVVLTPGHKALFFSVTGTDGCTGGLAGGDGRLRSA